MRVVTVHSSIPNLASHLQVRLDFSQCSVGISAVEIFNIFDHFKRRVGSNTMVVNMDPSLPLDETITSKTDFLITEHGALGTATIAQWRSMKLFLISGPILKLKDFGRLQFVQNTWAGVDSLARQLAGRLNQFS